MHASHAENALDMCTPVHPHAPAMDTGVSIRTDGGYCAIHVHPHPDRSPLRALPPNSCSHYRYKHCLWLGASASAQLRVVISIRWARQQLRCNCEAFAVRCVLVGTVHACKNHANSLPPGSISCNTWASVSLRGYRHTPRWGLGLEGSRTRPTQIKGANKMD